MSYNPPLEDRLNHLEKMLANPKLKFRQPPEPPSFVTQCQRLYMRSTKGQQVKLRAWMRRVLRESK